MPETNTSSHAAYCTVAKLWLEPGRSTPLGAIARIGRRIGRTCGKLSRMQCPRVFVIAPFDPEGSRVQDVVRRAIKETGLRVVQFSGAIRPGAELTSAILGSIREADLIIADVSRQNPNVFYELGFAHALRKQTILLVSDKSGPRLPSDLTGLEYIDYDPANLERLVDLVKDATEDFTTRRSA